MLVFILDPGAGECLYVCTVAPSAGEGLYVFITSFGLMNDRL